MQNNHQEAEVIDFQDIKARTSGNGGGFDHFTTMEIGTVFAVAVNSGYGSQLTDYKLLSKAGVTVLLANLVEERLERHIGQKFWNIHTLVQILHIPETTKENDNGNSP